MLSRAAAEELRLRARRAARGRCRRRPEVAARHRHPARRCLCRRARHHGHRRGAMDPRASRPAQSHRSAAAAGRSTRSRRARAWRSCAAGGRIRRHRAVAARPRQRATRAYRVNLDMLALVALLTGAFLVFATQWLSILRRRVALGLLRALGVTRAELRRALLAEAPGRRPGGLGAGHAAGHAACRAGAALTWAPISATGSWPRSARRCGCRPATARLRSAGNRRRPGRRSIAGLASRTARARIGAQSRRCRG